MMQEQKTVLKVEIAGKVFQLYCDNDSPLGSLHDALMQMKGAIVDRMISNQQKESEMAQEMLKVPDETEE